MGVETSAERDSAPAKPVASAPPAAAFVAPSEARMLALQRASGNRAVGRLVARRAGAIALQRCPGPACRCAERDEEERLSRSDRRVLQRDLVDSIGLGEAADVLLNMPSYQPNPAWSKAGSDNPAPTCTPFGKAEARARWALMWEVVPAAIKQRCGCDAVAGAYRTFLLATGGTVGSTDPTSCINTQLASEDKAHKTAEDDAINAALRKVPALLKSSPPAPGATASLPLVPTLFGGTSNQRKVRITYTKNTMAGGLLMGGDSDDGTTPDSEYGPDLRFQSGNLVLRRTDDGSDPATVRVEARLDFHYDVNDALDFCPGNTLQKPDTLGNLDYNFVITTLSRLEASGMARDVKIEGHYDRHHDLGTFTA